MEISDTNTKATMTGDDGPSDYASSYQGTMGPTSERSERTDDEKTETDTKIDLTDIASKLLLNKKKHSHIYLLHPFC